MNIRSRFVLTVCFLILSSLPAWSGVVPVSADLTVSKTGPDQAAADTDITYTIQVVNNGPDQATAASMTDNVPANTKFVSFTKSTQDSGSAWNCSTPSPGATGQISCSNNALDAGSTSTFTLVVHIDPGTPPGTAITNVANVSDPSEDPDDENNSSSVTTFIPTTAADLGVAKATDSDQALPNSNVTFTVQVTNSGPDAALTAAMSDTLPGNMTFVSFSQTSGPTWSCSTPSVGSGGTVSCTNASVAASTTSTFVITGHIPSTATAGTEYQNIAFVTSSNDPNSENDSDDATTAVVAAAPTLTTQASAGVTLGGSISDTATLSGGQSPTGTIDFFAYGPNDSVCGSNPAFTSSVAVNGNGPYPSGSFVPNAPGTYRFVASYSGDFNNKAVATSCSDPAEAVAVATPTPTPTPTATATATATATSTPTPTATATSTPTATATATATPTATPTATATATPTATPTASPAQALNISTRLRTDLGDRVMIGGFIITGNADTPKAVVLRGLGPSLAKFGLTDLLLDPVLELRGNSGNVIFQNDNWKDTQRSQIEGTPFQPTDDRESVIVTTLPPAPYTVFLTGKNQTTGIGTVEIYDNNQGASSQLGNMSTRGFVQTQDKVMIGGFTLGVNNGTSRIAIRGLGPSLARSGLNNVLADPTLELRNSNGTLLAANDDWQSDPVSAAQLTTNGLGLPDQKESGIFISLPGGQFTAILAGKNGGVGIGLVEIYNLK